MPSHQPPSVTSTSVNPTRVAMIGTYVPRRCGIATFTSDLLTSLSAQAPGAELWAVAINDLAEGYAYPPEVQFEVGQKAVGDYRTAADFLNINEVDAVLLQHEFGIFGGKTGSNILKLLQNLRMPVVTALHTVLDEPDDDQRQTIAAINDLSDRVVVMSKRARRILNRVYGLPDQRIAVIPHGVPDVPFLDTSYHKDQFGLVGQKVILSFGLLSRGKGIEYVIAAMPRIVAAHPDAVYVVLGETHPGVKREEGEAYRDSLQALAAELGVADRVKFDARYMDTRLLTEFLSTADIVVTPYLNREQIVSGVLSYALGAGKAIISTPYWYAEEILADGRGRLVPFRNADAVADEVIDLLSNDVERQAMRKQSYTFARDMVWSEVGARYMGLFREVRRERAVKPRIYQARSLHSNPLELPPARLDHLRVLTDDTGILQHARFAVPDRNHGYCTDDNARALIVALMGQHVLREADLLVPFAYRYLSFLQHAFNESNGRFRNFMSFDRQWLEAVGSEDSHGRALWGLGHTVFDSPVARHARQRHDAVRERSSRGACLSSAPRLGVHPDRPRLLSPPLPRRERGAPHAHPSRREAVRPVAGKCRARLAVAGEQRHLRQRDHSPGVVARRRAARAPGHGRCRVEDAALADGRPDRPEGPFRRYRLQRLAHPRRSSCPLRPATDRGAAHGRRFACGPSPDRRAPMDG